MVLVDAERCEHEQVPLGRHTEMVNDHKIFQIIIHQMNLFPHEPKSNQIETKSLDCLFPMNEKAIKKVICSHRSVR
jgi:hypothetical protein